MVVRATRHMNGLALPNPNIWWSLGHVMNANEIAMLKTRIRGARR